jgi:hypothetical protein
MLCKLSLSIWLDHQNPEIISHINMNSCEAKYMETIREQDDEK